LNITLNDVTKYISTTLSPSPNTHTHTHTYTRTRHAHKVSQFRITVHRNGGKRPGMFYHVKAVLST